MMPICEIHGFIHYGSQDVTITSVVQTYVNTFTRCNVGGVSKYGKLTSQVTSKTANLYAFEMLEECPDGFNKNHSSIFTCENRRGVLVSKTGFECCQFSNKHNTLTVYNDDIIDEESVCCVKIIDNLEELPTLVIENKCIFQKNGLMSYVGVCKWIGKINNIEFVGVEMTSWISNECNGFCCGIKIFDCREGYGILLRSSDIEMVNPDGLDFNKSGFIDLKNIYRAQRISDKFKDTVKIGRRCKSLHVEKGIFGVSDIKIIYGVFKWIGIINNRKCVGVELDYPCEGAMDGIITPSESFTCEPDQGALLSLQNVIFDYYIYNVEFTVGEKFNIDCDLMYKENWNQAIVHERNLKINENIYVYIENDDRILSLKGILRWCGFIQDVSVAILEMPADFPITPQQKISSILKNPKQVPYFTVNTEYLFKYRKLKSYEKIQGTLLNFELENETEFGVVKWKGIDNMDCLYYGFEAESSSEGYTDGTFNGQMLFQCCDGHGTLISAKEIHNRISSTIDESCLHSDYKDDQDSNMGVEDMKLILNTIKLDKDSYYKLINEVLATSNKKLLIYLIENYPQWINISKYPSIITELKKLQLTDLLKELIEKCVLEGIDNEDLLKLALEALRNEFFSLFQKIIDKCTERNMIMENGETFLTNIIKENFSTKLILMVIESNKFSTTIPNNNNETPLMLVCSNMMVDVVESLLLSIKNQSIHQVICAICLDRSVSTIFGCGHNSCKDCSDNIVNCHMCSKEITSRGPLFLNN